MNVEIYIAGHKDFVMVPSAEVFHKLHIGRQGKNENFAPFTDDKGDNISSKNCSFCELTALYWVWKNTVGQDYIGIFHYRRHLNFSDKRKKADKWGFVCYQATDSQYIKETALNDEAVRKAVEGYDIILPEKFPVSNTKEGPTVIKHYGNSKYHHISDYKAAISLIKEKYPSFACYCDKVSRAKSAYFCNIFIMRRSIFDQYCTWLFDILFELEKRIDIRGRSSQELRVFGYLSERLFNIFFEKLCADNQDLKVKTLQMTFVDYRSFTMKSLSFEEKNKNILTSNYKNNLSVYKKINREINRIITQLQDFTGFR